MNLKSWLASIQAGFFIMLLAKGFAAGGIETYVLLLLGTLTASSLLLFWLLARESVKAS